jgi:regulator of sigma E protease
MITVLSFLVAIIFLVFIHECGHFFVARLCGVKVKRFAIGFGKPIFKYKSKSEIEYTLSPILLGGYVKMLDERESPVAENQKKYAFNNQHPSKKIAIAGAGPFINIVFSVLVYWMLFVTGIPGLLPVVGEVDQGSLAERYGVMANDRILAVNHSDTSSYQNVSWELLSLLGKTGDIHLSLKSDDNSNFISAAAREVVLPVSNWLANKDSPNPLSELGIHMRRINFEMYIGSLIKNSPADKGGLKEGDKIIEINETLIASWYDGVDIISKNPNIPVSLVVLRESKKYILTVTPELKKLNGGQSKGFIGVGPDYSKIPDVPEEWMTLTQLSLQFIY